MSNEPHINFSNLRKHFPYTFTLHNWQRAPRYNRFFYLFDASVEFNHGTRMFKLCLPAYQIERAILRLPVRDKDVHTAKITFLKLDEGKIDITHIEKIK